MFDLVAPDGSRHGLVLRRDPASHTGWSERATEYQVLEAAAAAGVPVPRFRVLLGPGDELGHGFVMDRVEGETIARRILRDDAYATARPLMAAQCGEIAARIHATDVATLPELPVQGRRRSDRAIPREPRHLRRAAPRVRVGLAMADRAARRRTRRHRRSYTATFATAT